MGCITSKLMPKSLSFKEELNQSLQRRSNSISSIQELIISGNKTDQFLDLLCSANMLHNKLGSQSLIPGTPESDTNPRPDTKHVSTENFRALDLATNEGQEEQPHATNSLVRSAAPLMDVDDLARRSKSCHWSPEIELSSTDSSDMGKKLRGRARSIRTVEEYDAILEKLWLSKSNDKKSTDEASRKEKRSTETTGADSNSPADKGEVQELNSSEKGCKRKAVAKGLESLSLPQTIEFQNVGSLKDWLQVHSPITPKFGSYALPSSTTENQCSESVAFNAELVAAFEECMQQLQTEEEIVLKQIVKDLEDASNNDKQAETDIEVLI